MLVSNSLLITSKCQHNCATSMLFHYLCLYWPLFLVKGTWSPSTSNWFNGLIDHIHSIVQPTVMLETQLVQVDQRGTRVTSTTAPTLLLDSVSCHHIYVQGWCWLLLFQWCKTVEQLNSKEEKETKNIKHIYSHYRHRHIETIVYLKPEHLDTLWILQHTAVCWKKKLM